LSGAQVSSSLSVRTYFVLKFMVNVSI
jgi:hypothetical protein